MKKHFIALSLIVLAGAGCLSNGTDTSTDPTTDVIDRDSILLEAKENGLIMNDEEAEQMGGAIASDEGTMAMDETASYLDVDVKGWESAALADVTGGESFGLAYATYQEGAYTMIAKMGSLPVPAEGYFYEGWIVRRGEELSVISTGPVEYVEDQVVNVYKSATDLRDHDFYVLTLEPDDGDPAPAEHILEGTFK